MLTHILKHIEKVFLNNPIINRMLVNLGIITAKVILSTTIPTVRPTADKLSNFAETLYPAEFIPNKKEWVSIPIWKYQLLKVVLSLSEYRYCENELLWQKWLQENASPQFKAENRLISVIDCALATSNKLGYYRVINKSIIDLFFDSTN